MAELICGVRTRGARAPMRGLRQRCAAARSRIARALTRLRRFFLSSLALPPQKEKTGRDPHGGAAPQREGGDGAPDPRTPKNCPKQGERNKNAPRRNPC